MNPFGALQTRRDFIETSYVNGVKDSKGKEVIRPLTKDEAEWLAQYYQETEHVDFLKTEELDKEQKKLKQLRSKHLSHKKLTGEEHPDVTEQRVLVENLRVECNSFYPTDEVRRKLYKQDNDRRKDIYNVAKITGNLVTFDINEYDRFVFEGLDFDDARLLEEED